MIRVKNLAKHFGGVYAVKDCSFDIKPGKITSVIGPNGAGKTTMFNLVCNIISADDGSVYFKKENITRLPTHKIARVGISRTFQQARLFKNLTVKENLTISRPCSEKEIRDVLEKVAFKLPIDTKGSALSYGQMRLLEIARALLHPHELLMLDEPTAGVNPSVRQELKKILKQLNKEGKTIMFIEHDMDFVMSISDEVIVMAEGRVLMRGTPKQVQKDKRVLEAYLGK
ncbi:ABC transporter ATP-binding protein [Candidatus Woesearchaeota archaeon CG10_big_fil_rev_8_21_14_0_10_37_12]|nr:MAG: ABC transporter ATP-binding protein [Candidatus Woesearchaeota archaeon CG10_big_fil_rev_8_21_14_0_10_37_12]